MWSPRIYNDPITILALVLFVPQSSNGIYWEYSRNLLVASPKWGTVLEHVPGASAGLHEDEDEDEKEVHRSECIISHIGVRHLAVRAHLWASGRSRYLGRPPGAGGDQCGRVRRRPQHPVPLSGFLGVAVAGAPRNRGSRRSCGCSH